MNIRLNQLVGSPYDVITILKYLPTLGIPVTIENYGSVDNDKFELFHITFLNNTINGTIRSSGGAIYFNDEGYVYDSTFKDNYCYYENI